MNQFTIKAGETFGMHKEIGKVRENCLYVTCVEDVPQFIREDKSFVVNEDGTVTMFAIECPATRAFPIYLCWQKVSAENKDKVPGKYGVWSKDNGADTLLVKDGKCYNLPSMVKATLITEDVPQWVIDAGFPVEKKGDEYLLNRTDWGEVRHGRIRKALWCLYGEGDVNILDLAEESVKEYIVTVDGQDVGFLVEFI